MKKQKSYLKKNFIKKLFFKFCRIIGYEIIDQSNFHVPTQNKYLNENLSSPGTKSIVLPLGETKITRPVKSLTVIYRSCTNVNMLTQNKARIFDKPKSEYTLRSLNSILVSIKLAMEKFPRVQFNIIIVDHKSKKDDLLKIKNLIKNSKINNSIINLDINEFKDGIKKINAENKKVTDNQISNMSNINKSLLIAKEKCDDLVYFVEDDYLHEKEAITEMVFTYERIASQIKKELILCPIDYPFLYKKIDNTNIFLGSSRHWRVASETLCTFLTSVSILSEHWNKFLSMCVYEHYPFELPLHEIYKLETCLSPIPTLALHCTNINSAYGLSPNIDWKRIWDENENH